MSQKQTTDTGEQGFTLIEVMIALLLLLIGMTGVAMAQLQSLRYASNSAQRSKALYMAEEGLEIFHAMAFDNTALTTPGVIQDPANPIDIDTQDDDVTEYYRCWLVTPNQPRAGVSLITVEVRIGDPGCNPADPRPPSGAYARITGVKG